MLLLLLLLVVMVVAVVAVGVGVVGGDVDSQKPAKTAIAATTATTIKVT